MKPHTCIIYYTLLCLALNHRRSRAHIYGEGESVVGVFVCILICTTNVCVYLCAYVCLHEHVCTLVCGICRIC